MTQTTYSAIEIDSKLWLVPGMVMREPCLFDHGGPVRNLEKMRDYNLWLSQKQGWIEVPEEHKAEFVGRTRLVEDVDFVTRGYSAYHHDGDSGTVAIPIKTDQGEDENKMWSDVIGKAVSDFLHDQSFEETLGYYNKNYSIKRKQ